MNRFEEVHDMIMLNNLLFNLPKIWMLSKKNWFQKKKESLKKISKSAAPKSR